jgi:hypothetical protein
MCSFPEGVIHLANPPWLIHQAIPRSVFPSSLHQFELTDLVSPEMEPLYQDESAKAYLTEMTFVFH